MPYLHACLVKAVMRGSMKVRRGGQIKERKFQVGELVWKMDKNGIQLKGIITRESPGKSPKMYVQARLSGSVRE